MENARQKVYEATEKAISPHLVKGQYGMLIKVLHNHGKPVTKAKWSELFEASAATVQEPLRVVNWYLKKTIQEGYVREVTDPVNRQKALETINEASKNARSHKNTIYIEKKSKK